MKASELRIGNFVFDDEGILSKINGFQPYGHSIRCDEKEGCELLIDLYLQNGTIRKGFETDINYNQPVQLTEEWLLKFGFNEMLGKFVINPNSGYNVCVALRNNKWYLYNDDCDAECNIICGVETVHRLQNLFFDIWNFELELKDDYYR